MHFSKIIPASFAALSMVSTVIAVQCSDQVFCDKIACDAPFAFPAGCGDGSSGFKGVPAKVSWPCACILCYI